jgi:hypothetical protein
MKFQKKDGVNMSEVSDYSIRIVTGWLLLYFMPRQWIIISAAHKEEKERRSSGFSPAAGCALPSGSSLTALLGGA